MRRYFALTLLLGAVSLVPTVVRADAAADRKAELDRKKEEAKKKADERAKAKAAAAAAAGGSTGAGGTASASAGAATTSVAGTTGTASGGAGGTASTAAGGNGGNAGKGGSAGATSKGGAGGAATAEKDAPLPAVDIETLRKDRTDRRKSTVERLRKRWGNLLANEKGTADLKQHARRVAFLQRIRAVADSKKDAKSVEAVDQLLTQEDERHTKAMNSLREGALP